MKYILTYSIALFIGTWLLCSCSKNDVGTNQANINLRDTNLYTVQAYAIGKWKLIYAYGGWLYEKYSPANMYYYFSKDSLKITVNDTVTTDINISWERKSLFGDSSYVLVDTTAGSLTNIIITGIVNDSLCLIDNHYEPYYYRLIKAN